MIELKSGTNDDCLEFLTDSGVRPTLIVADPSWVYKQTGGGDAKKFRSTVKRLYPLQGNAAVVETLARAARLATDDAILAMWGTTPLRMEIATQVAAPLQAWGLWHYATSFYWHKSGAPGMGQWCRGDVEELWIFARKANGSGGRIPARLKAQMTRRCDSNFYSCPRHTLEHSEKPVELERRIIERFTLPGETVLSLWPGTFTTGVACMGIDRDCIGYEPDEDQRAIGLGKIWGGR